MQMLHLIDWAAVRYSFFSPKAAKEHLAEPMYNRFLKIQKWGHSPLLDFKKSKLLKKTLIDNVWGHNCKFQMTIYLSQRTYFQAYVI